MKKRLLTILMAFVMMISLMPMLGNMDIYAAANPYPGNMNSNCTYAAWQKTKDILGIELPSWGNAWQWYGKAQSAGYSVGTTPKANSIVVFKQASWNGNYGHVAFVSDYNASTGKIYKLEGNYNGTYHEGWAPAWESDMYGYIYLNGSPAPTNHAPEGTFRVAVGGEGYVFVRGWAYDPDDMSKQIAVDVYIGAPLGDASAEGHRISANKQDPEGHNSGANHGFSENITTSKRGHIPVYCYAVDTSMTSNTLLSGTCLWVDVVSDATAPTISDLKVISQDSDGYTLSCKVTDSGTGVNRVQFPTWTLNNGQDDLASNWQTNNSVKGSKNGDVYTFRVNRAEHKNEYGNYVTDVYAWDNAGNCKGPERIGVTLSNPITPPSSKGPAVQTPTLGVNVKISKPKAAKKAVTVKWKKISKKNQKKISGVQIQIAADPGFSNIVKTATAGKKKTSKKIKGLAKKTTYYVRVRTFRGGEIGTWSGVKRVKTK